MNMNQEDYWDQAALTKEFTTPFRRDVFARHVTKKARILDVGCGYGRVANELYQSGFEQIQGIDYSQQMIEKGHGLYPHLWLKKGSSPFEFADHSFDAVILVAVLTCIVEDTAQQSLIQDIVRVLKPGGVLYINDFLLNHDVRNIQRYDQFKDVHHTYGVFELDEGAVLRHHSTEYLEGLLSDFDVLEFETCVYATMNRHTSNGFCFMGQLEKDC